MKQKGKGSVPTWTRDTCLAIETSMRIQQRLFPELITLQHVSNMLDVCGFMNYISLKHDGFLIAYATKYRKKSTPLPIIYSILW